MPKPIFQDNGSGMHVHQSLWKGEKNLFFEGGTYADLSEDGAPLHRRRAEARAGAAGVLRADDQLVPPPGAGLRGADQPDLLAAQPVSAAVRIPAYSRSEKAKRIEVRFPDPSANGYLAFSALLMAGLDGIQNKIMPTGADRQGPLRPRARGPGEGAEGARQPRRGARRAREGSRLPAQGRRVHPGRDRRLDRLQAQRRKSTRSACGRIRGSSRCTSTSETTPVATGAGVAPGAGSVSTSGGARRRRRHPIQRSRLALHLPRGSLPLADAHRGRGSRVPALVRASRIPPPPTSTCRRWPTSCRRARRWAPSPRRCSTRSAARPIPTPRWSASRAMPRPACPAPSFLRYLVDDPRALDVLIEVMRDLAVPGRDPDPQPRVLPLAGVAGRSSGARDRGSRRGCRLGCSAQAENESGHADALRRFKRREILRIAARDILGGETLESATAQISDLADVVTERALRIATRTVLEGRRRSSGCPGASSSSAWGSSAGASSTTAPTSISSSSTSPTTRTTTRTIGSSTSSAAHSSRC